MKAWIALVACLPACSFTHGAALASDAHAADAPAADAGIDAAVRVSAGLVAYWTFDEADGSKVANDTSGSAMPVPLDVITGGAISAPTFAGGSVTAATPARLLSANGTHLASDCLSAGGVTLEAWLAPANASQGSITEPAFIAGIAGGVNARDIVLLQAGTHWLGRVRTTAALDGKPDLLSTSAAVTSTMTHVVLVADPTQRTLYVNGAAEAIDTPGGPLNWDPSYPAAVFDEPQHARQWLGTVALVALYARGLTADEVQQNFLAGPMAP